MTDSSVQPVPATTHAQCICDGIKDLRAERKPNGSIGPASPACGRDVENSFSNIECNPRWAWSPTLEANMAKSAARVSAFYSLYLLHTYFMTGSLPGSLARVVMAALMPALPEPRFVLHVWVSCAT